MAASEAADGGAAAVVAAGSDAAAAASCTAVGSGTSLHTLALRYPPGRLPGPAFVGPQEKEPLDCRGRQTCWPPSPRGPWHGLWAPSPRRSVGCRQKIFPLVLDR